MKDIIRRSTLAPVDLLREIYVYDIEKNKGLNKNFYSVVVTNPNLPSDIVEDLRQFPDARYIQALEIYNTYYKEKYAKEIKAKYFAK